MDKVKNVAKGGWHPPGRDGGKESWRGDNKGINQVAGWLGKGKDPNTAAKEHTSRPLAALKDPDAFGPPPKHVNYHGGAAVPNAITPDRRGLGEPLNTQEIQAKEAEARRAEVEAANKPAPPPVPYRVNTTGIDTRNLPKPPVRRLVQEDEGHASNPPVIAKPKPSLPPRLPPRQNSRPNLHAPDPPPTYTAAVQQTSSSQKDDFNLGALSRLGKAGVTVPEFGIGSKPQSTSTESQSSNPWASDSPAATDTHVNSPPPVQNTSLTSLQSRSSKLSTAAPSQAPNQGTTTQQKQDAIRTASAFQKDPSSVSLADARGAASTANNFRERHGDQVAAGGRWAGAMNKKYDVASKVNGYAGGNAHAINPQGQASPAQVSDPSPWANEPSAGYGDLSPSKESPPVSISHQTQSPVTGPSKKAPPPPPQARKPGPPPVPLSSKPRS